MHICLFVFPSVTFLLILDENEAMTARSHVGKCDLFISYLLQHGSPITSTKANLTECRSTTDLRRYTYQTGLEKEQIHPWRWIHTCRDPGLDYFKHKPIPTLQATYLICMYLKHVWDSSKLWCVYPYSLPTLPFSSIIMQRTWLPSEIHTQRSRGQA